jgi:hypothetical protein
MKTILPVLAFTTFAASHVSANERLYCEDNTAQPWKLTIDMVSREATEADVKLEKSGEAPTANKIAVTRTVQKDGARFEGNLNGTSLIYELNNYNLRDMALLSQPNNELILFSCWRNGTGSTLATVNFSYGVSGYPNPAKIFQLTQGNSRNAIPQVLDLQADRASNTVKSVIFSNAFVSDKTPRALLSVTADSSYRAFYDAWEAGAASIDVKTELEQPTPTVGPAITCIYSRDGEPLSYRDLYRGQTHSYPIETQAGVTAHMQARHELSGEIVISRKVQRGQEIEDSVVSSARAIVLSVDAANKSVFFTIGEGVDNLTCRR